MTNETFQKLDAPKRVTEMTVNDGDDVDGLFGRVRCVNTAAGC